MNSSYSVKISHSGLTVAYTIKRVERVVSLVVKVYLLTVEVHDIKYEMKSVYLFVPELNSDVAKAMTDNDSPHKYSPLTVAALATAVASQLLET